MTIREEAFEGKPLSCTIIDAHTHLGSEQHNGWHQKYDRIETKDTVEDFRRLGIDCIVTAPHALLQSDMEAANALAAQAAEQFPGRIYGYISVAPVCGLDAVKEAIQLYGQNAAFIGFKFLTGYHGDIFQPEYEYAMDFANETGCPVLCHEWGDNPRRSNLEAAAAARPNMKLLIAHQGGGTAEDTLLCAPMVQSNENIYMELCGSLYNQIPVEQIVELVGENKVIFGTDLINLDPKYELGRVAFAPLGDNVKKKIFAGNFQRILNSSQMGQIVL